MTELTTQEKVAAIEASGLSLAYDGCHKIYVMEGAADEAEMRGYGYDLADDSYPASEIRRLINESCGLVFVHSANLRDDFPWDIGQGDLYDAYGDADV